jgi:hypothetical protein
VPLFGKRKRPGELTLVEAYARLKSLRQNLPEQPVPLHYVAEYHQVLDLLESALFNLQGFRIPQSEVRPVEVGGSHLSGEVHHPSDSYCDRSFFLMKVDAVLTMFEILLTGPGGSRLSIHFGPPK